MKVMVGTTAKGEPRYETQHWENVKVAHMREEAETATRTKRGRKPLNPEARPFVPKSPSKQKDMVPPGDIDTSAHSEKKDNSVQPSARPRGNVRRPLRYSA